MENILKEVYKYDKKELLEQYNLDLRSVVYLLQLKNYIKFSCSIYTLSQKYNKKYYTIEEKKDCGDSALKMEDGIKNNLRRIWYITNDYKPWLTEEWIKTIQEIYIRVKGSKFSRFELYLKKHVWVNFVIGMLWVLDILYRIITSIISYLKSHIY